MPAALIELDLPDPDGSSETDDDQPQWQYAYDKLGNNRLESDGVYQYEYDEEGNRTRRIELIDDEPEGETTEYIWDHRNRLTAVITKATPTGAAIHTVIYAYDVFDRKVRRDVDEIGDGTTVDSRELYVYDGADVLFDFEDEDANGGDPQVLARRYLHGPAVDQVLAQEEVGDDTYWLLADLQGSTRDIVRHNGTTTVLVEHLDYNSFGEPVIASAVTRYGYTAREYDTDTGLQYNRARWYDPETGRFPSEDPIGFTATDPNLVRYVRNSPVNARDPSGLIEPIETNNRSWEYPIAVWRHKDGTIYPADAADSPTIAEAYICNYLLTGREAFIHNYAVVNANNSGYKEIVWRVGYDYAVGDAEDIRFVTNWTKGSYSMLFCAVSSLAPRSLPTARLPRRIPIRTPATSDQDLPPSLRLGSASQTRQAPSATEATTPRVSGQRYWWKGRYCTPASQPGAYQASDRRVFPTRRNSGLSADILRAEQRAFARQAATDDKLIGEVRGQAHEAGLTRLQGPDRLADPGVERAIIEGHSNP